MTSTAYTRRVSVSAPSSGSTWAADAIIPWRTTRGAASAGPVTRTRVFPNVVSRVRTSGSTASFAWKRSHHATIAARFS
jgi:hypothetical protein